MTFKKFCSTNDTRLIKHNCCLYKIKLLFKNSSECSHHKNICKTNSDSVHDEIEEVIRAVLFNMERKDPLIKIQTTHYLVTPELKLWKLQQQLGFIQNGHELEVCPYAITLGFVPRTSNELPNKPASVMQDKDMRSSGNTQKRRYIHKPITSDGSTFNRVQAKRLIQDVDKSLQNSEQEIIERHHLAGRPPTPSTKNQRICSPTENELVNSQDSMHAPTENLFSAARTSVVNNQKVVEINANPKPANTDVTVISGGDWEGRTSKKSGNLDKRHISPVQSLSEHAHFQNLKDDANISAHSNNTFISHDSKSPPKNCRIQDINKYTPVKPSRSNFISPTIGKSSNIRYSLRQVRHRSAKPASLENHVCNLNSNLNNSNVHHTSMGERYSIRLKAREAKIKGLTNVNEYAGMWTNGNSTSSIRITIHKNNLPTSHTIHTKGNVSTSGVLIQQSQCSPSSKEKDLPEIYGATHIFTKNERSQMKVDKFTDAKEIQSETFIAQPIEQTLKDYEKPAQKSHLIRNDSFINSHCHKNHSLQQRYPTFTHSIDQNTSLTANQNLPRMEMQLQEHRDRHKVEHADTCEELKLQQLATPEMTETVSVNKGVKRKSTGIFQWLLTPFKRIMQSEIA